VISKWEDNPNGPYEYHHSFIYQKTTESVCDSCGHKTVKQEWDSDTFVEEI
jgi:hypothetical protein